MTKLDFSFINKEAAASFNQQRNLIKKVLKGQKVLCEQCNQPVLMTSSDKEQVSIGCSKGCTNIDMDKD